MNKTQSIYAWQDRRTGTGYETAEALSKRYNRDNWRLHPEAQRAAVEESLETLGWVGQIKVNRLSGHLLDGHLRVELALVVDPQMQLPVDYYELNEEEEALALATLDSSTEMAEPDREKLNRLMEKARGLLVDKPQLSAMLSDLKERANGADEGQAGKDTPPAVDKAAELQEKWGTALGQVWQLGQHRLICGDCTDRAVVEQVMGGERAMLCVSSPPYPGADMWSKENEDKETQIDRLNHLNKNALRMVWDILNDGGVCCWNIQDVPYGDNGVITTTTTTTTTIAVKEIGFSIRGNIIWDKGIPHLPLPWNMRRPCVPNMTHEHILVLFKGRWQPREKNTGLSDSEKTILAYGVWKISTESAKKIGHKAPFPVELASNCVSLFSLQDELILDPFLGSGTTLIACENLDRQCRAVEISPAYTAVCLERFFNHTGIEPALINNEQTNHHQSS